MIEIDKDIPLPTKQRFSAPIFKYPWVTMEIGDSFYVVGQKYITQQASRAGKVYGRKFVTATNGKGVRVWRVA